MALVPTRHDYEGVTGPVEPFRHVSIAETEDPEHGRRSVDPHLRDASEVFLASEISLKDWRILLGGAYDPDTLDERFNFLGAVTATGAGLTSIVLPPIPAGQDWMVDAITYATTAGAAVATCTRIDSAIDPGSIIDVNPATAMVGISGVFAYRSNLNIPEYVPQGRQLYVQFVAAGADTFFCRVRYRLRQGEPVKDN